MSQNPSPPAASPPEFVIPEWFQEEDAADLPAGEPVALPDIFDDLSAVRETGEAAVIPSMSVANPAPSEASAALGVTVNPGATTGTPKAIAISGTTTTPGTADSLETNPTPATTSTPGATVIPGVTATPGTTAAPGLAPLPSGEAPCRSDPARAQRLFEIASALGFMARGLRTWDHEGAEGAAHLLASLAAELAGIAASGDSP